MPPIRDLVVLGVILASLPLCFFRPFYGVGLWTILAYLNPHRMAWGAARDFPVALLVAGATVAGFLVFERRFKNLGRAETLFVIALWAWFAITTVVTTRLPIFGHHGGDTWERFHFVSKILLMTLVSLSVVDNWTRLRRFVLCIAAAFGILIVMLLPWMAVTGGAFRAYGPNGTMIADNNDFGLALNMVFPIFFFLAKTEEAPKIRALFWFLAAVTVPAVFFTWSRGALVGLIVVIGFIFIGTRYKLVLAPILILAVTLAVFFTPQAWQDRMTGIVNDPADRSVQGRFNAWHFAWNLALDYPLTGGGFATFTPELFARYAPNPRDYHAAHSIYFGILGEHGFVGLALFLGLLASCFWSLYRLKGLGRRWGDERLVAYSRMFTSSLIAYAASGAFLGRHYFDLFFAIVACVVMLKAAVANEILTGEAEDSEDADWETEESAPGTALGGPREVGAL
jgi:probable O-glycosylation ligase (exosortase A-associated)